MGSVSGGFVFLGTRLLHLSQDVGLAPPALPSPWGRGGTAELAQEQLGRRRKREEEKTCRVLPVNTLSDTELMRGLCGISVYISQSDFSRQKDTNRTLRDQSL